MKANGALDQAKMERLYGAPSTDVVACPSFHRAMAFKLTLWCRWVQGSGGECDTLGARQHAPLPGVIVP